MSGWYPDPTGRFGQRWYDGHRWTAQVVAASGSAIEDPLPDGARPFPPPVQQAPAPAAQPPGVHSGPPHAAAPAAHPAHASPVAVAPHHGGAAGAVRLRPGATLAIGLLGVLLVALSLLGVPWSTEGSGLSFFDVSEAAREWSGDGELVIRIYGAFAGFLMLFLALVFVVGAGVPLPRSPAAATINRMLTSFGCSVAVVLHTVTVVRIFRGPASPEIGAWLGVVGYFVIIAAMVVGHHRRVPR